jgi:Protein of unknown function (DUF3108)
MRLSLIIGLALYGLGTSQVMAQQNTNDAIGRASQSVATQGKPNDVATPRSAAQGVQSSPAPTGETQKKSQPIPRQGQVEYVVMRGNGGFVVGRARHQWQLEGKQYVFKSSVETTGLVAMFKSVKATQESRGEFTANGYQPTEFVQERGKGTERAQFDWKQGRVRNGEVVDTLVGGTQDVLSIYYQLSWLNPTRGVVELPIATGRKLDEYQFEIIGAETLETEMGSQTTTHLRAKTGNDTMDLWIAPSISPLPLRITILNKKGELYDQRMKRTSP